MEDIKLIRAIRITARVVLTAPTVVKYYSRIDEQKNRYVIFMNNEKRYFPQKLHFQNIEYSNQCDAILQELLKSNLLYKKNDDNQQNLFHDNDGVRDPLWEAQVVHQGCSSIKQMDELLNKLSYAGGFERIRFQNQDALTQFAIEKRKNLQQVLKDNDEKIEKLVEIITRFNSEKVVIFCHYRETAKYVNNSLATLLPGIKVETTVDIDANKMEAIVQRFAPKANKVDYFDNGDVVNDEIQVLVATGAMSEGFNFQDARVLINLDDVLNFIETADGLHTSSFLDDIATIDETLEQHILRLPMGIRSVKKSYLKQDKVLYILFKSKNRYYPVLFDFKGKIIFDSDKMNDIMHIIRSESNEEIAVAPMTNDEIDAWIMRSKNKWIIKHHFTSTDVMVDCAMVIIS